MMGVSYQTKSTSPKNGDKLKTKDGVIKIFRNGSWKKLK